MGDEPSGVEGRGETEKKRRREEEEEEEKMEMKMKMKNSSGLSKVSNAQRQTIRQSAAADQDK